jgi:site-specific recombinase XerD
MIERAGIQAKLGFKAHPHMLRHACGYARQQRARHPSATGVSRHKNIQHTVRYTELTPTQFKDFWRK